ncbi:MAG: DUF2344 domain-containing protein [Lachnospiraceae bacterium]|nr:DUF2344 domain-containing protein [Lachnospiraceae bacterium]
MKLRVKFTKHGIVRYIGHLDMQRYFQRVNRRAGIKVVYSEGFSPHQKMSFAMPLSVGYESDSEYFDMEVSEASSSENIITLMNAQQTEGIEIVSCVLLPDKCENAMASVRAARYTVGFREGYEPGFDVKRAVAEIMDGDSFIIKKAEKKKKKRAGRIERASYNTKTMGAEDPGEDAPEDKGYTEVDIRPHIYEMYADEDNTVHLMASAGSKDNIRPDAVMGAIYEREGHKLPPHALAVVRNELYTYGDNGKDLIPLSAVGREF